MTAYSTNFAGQTTGIDATNFTNRYASESNISIENPAVDEEADRVLELGTGDSGIQLQSFDDSDGDGSRADCDVVCRFWSTNDFYNQIGIMARASGSSGSETAYHMSINVSGQLTINEYQAGSFLQLAVGPNVDIEGAWFDWLGDFGTWVPAGVWLWMRLRVNGTGATVTIEATIWVDGQPEPSSPSMTFADTSGNRITANGWIGVNRSIHNGAQYVDYFGVETAGGVFAIEAGSPIVPSRATTVQAQVLHQFSATPVRVTTVQAQALHSTTSTPVRLTTVQAQVLYTRVTPRIGEPQTLIALINPGLD